MRMLMIPIALLLVIAGSQCLTAATGIATRRKATVWASARPEFGAALLFFGLALICSAIAGGLL